MDIPIFFISPTQAPGVWGGFPYLTMEEVPESKSLKPSQEVALRVNDTLLPFRGIVDPENQFIWLYPTTQLQSPEFWSERVNIALQLRTQFQLHPKTCYRLIHGEGDFLPGFQVDLYNDYAVLFVLSESLWNHARLLAQALWDRIPLKGLILTLREGEQTRKKPRHELFAGTVPKTIEVIEEGFVYEVHLSSGLNPGLFLDMRLNRLKLKTFIKGLKFLNLFSYTGSFSVVAAKSEAIQIVSVDQSQGALDWSRGNFLKNALDPQNPAYQFLADDVFSYLENTSDRFDLVLLDPPSWSKHGERPFFLKTHLEELLQKTFRVLNPRGLLWLHINSHQSRPEPLEKQIRQAAQQSSVLLQLLDISGLPPDFPTQMIYPQGRYLKSWLFRVNQR
ncbi:MAG: class I SAM-dependent methyltransferase [Planctomycetota bacterium]